MLGAIAGGLVFVSLPAYVNAAACQDSGNHGAVRLLLPEVPASGQYQLWIRMQSPSNTAKVQAELNGTECFEVGNSLLQPNTWTWVPYYTNNQNQTINIHAARGNIIKIIGTQASVKVDKVLLTDPSCTPQDQGGNCSGSGTVLLGQDSIVPVAPAGSGPVAGKAIISQTPFTQGSNLTGLSYSAGGRTLQSFVAAEPFDTTLLENGEHTVLIKTTLQDGTIIQESAIINIGNDETVLSPLRRWIRLQEKSLVVIALAMTSAALLAVLISISRRLYLKRRERHFHGF